MSEKPCGWTRKRVTLFMMPGISLRRWSRLTLGVALSCLPRPACADRLPPLVATPATPGAPAGRDGGGVAGVGTCLCQYAHDDGGGELDVGVVGGGVEEVVIANAYVVRSECAVLDTILVAWGVTLPSSAITVAIYNDPNNDGDPSDIAEADRLVSAMGVTANEGTDVLNAYAIAPTDVGGLGVIFVTAMTMDTGDDTPLRIDEGTSAMSSWFATGFTDADDPFQTGDVGLLDAIDLPGNFMIRAEGTGQSTCPSDLDGNLATDVDDLISVILDWSCGVAAGPVPCGQCAGDVDGDGDTDVDDLIDLVLAFGPCAIENETCALAPDAIGGAGTVVLGFINCEPTANPFNTVGASLDGAPYACAPGAAGDVWFRFVAACEGSLVIDTDGSGFDTVLEVYAAGNCAGLGAPLACDDGSGLDGLDSRVQLDGVQDGDTFFIRVGGSGGAEGGGSLNICCAQLVPDNDDCVGALPISNGLTPFSNLEATTDGPAHPECENFGDGGITLDDVWFSYVADCGGAPGDPGLLTISTCEDVGGSATFDTDLVIYDVEAVEGPICDNLAEALLGCNDDDLENPCGFDEPFHSRLQVPVLHGRQYLVRVGGWGGLGEDQDIGTGELFVDCQPADDDVCSFATAILPDVPMQVQTCSATIDSFAPVCSGGNTPGQPGRWLVAVGSGSELTLELCNLNDGSFPDTRLSVYCGNLAGAPGSPADCTDLRCVDAEPNDNNPNCPFTETLTWCGAPGVQYLILVHGQGVPGCGLIDVSLTESAGGALCDPPCVSLGACCLDGGDTCMDDVVDLQCAVLGGEHFAGQTCAAIQCPCDDFDLALQQHCSDTPLTGSIRCQQDGSQADSWYYRQFTASDGLTNPFTVCALEMGIFEVIAALGTAGTPVTICLYDVPLASLTFAPDGTTLTTPVACRTVLVTEAMTETYQLFPIGATISTGTLTVEVFTPSGLAGEFAGNSVDLADNRPINDGCDTNNACGGCGELTPSGSSFVRAPFCGVNSPVAYENLGPGFPGAALLWRVHGKAP
jgi:hypothetical protein